MLGAKLLFLQLVKKKQAS
jgi:hypothetical protein